MSMNFLKGIKARIYAELPIWNPKGEYGNITILTNFFSCKPANYPISLYEREKKELSALYKTSFRYLEYGAGGSTFLFLENSGPKSKMYAIESDSKWITFLKRWRVIRRNMHERRLEFKYVDIGEVGSFGTPINMKRKDDWNNYSNSDALWKDNSFDTVLIDGRFRVACAANVALNCNNECKILIHDYTFRKEYHVVEEFLDLVKVTDTLCEFRIKKNIDYDITKKIYESYKDNYE